MIKKLHSYTIIVTFATISRSIVFKPGGTPYYYSNTPGDNTLYDAFAATMIRGEIDDHDRRVQVKHFLYVCFHSSLWRVFMLPHIKLILQVISTAMLVYCM